ncbi:MAG: Kua-ubiquitin conjugating enzyme hybrid localization domain protein [Cyanobacteria bacterium RYN_339]|nr:Kua-ubiquitin conjugating enzyme hybrid localization domain protein [Cyanobacteria bacterium RYN_339]
MKRAAKIAVVAAAHAGACLYLWRAFLQPWTIGELALGLLAGHIFLDLLTLLIHWTVDNYFTPASPVIGSTVYYFREHHDKAFEMFNRDYVEGNFRNAGFSLLIQLGMAAWVTGCAGNAGMAVAGLGGAYITQIHKWAHMKQPPRPIALVQRARLLVGWEFHNIHHADTARHYGLYAGWFDRVFDRLRVFETAEHIIWRLTGARAVETRLGDFTT